MLLSPDEQCCFLPGSMCCCQVVRCHMQCIVKQCRENYTPYACPAGAEDGSQNSKCECLSL